MALSLGAVPSGAAGHPEHDAPEDPTSLGLPVASPESVGMSTERLERVTNAMQDYIDREEVAGVVTLIARRGKVMHLESLGYRHAEGKVPMTDDTIFRLASMTKPIASVALMMLWEEGRFQLRDPISKFLPEYAEMDVATVPEDNEQVGTT